MEKSGQNKELQQGIVKMPYFRCSCGAVNYFNNTLVRPDTSFKIEITNTRGNDGDVWVTFRCFKCKASIEFGITKNYVSPNQN